MGLLGEGVMADKRIAVLAGQLEEPYQQSFIRGIKKQAFANGYDVCIFSMFIKYQNNKERETGDSNIYNLVNIFIGTNNLLISTVSSLLHSTTLLAE